MMREGLTFDDVLMIPSYNGFTSRGDKGISTAVDLSNYKVPLYLNDALSIPIISANMDTITGSEMASKMGELGGLGILHRFMSIEENVQEYIKATDSHPTKRTLVGCSIGASDKTGANLERFLKLYEVGARVFCVDVAHGHSKVAGNMVKEIRALGHQDVFIIAGNVCTYAGADYLIGCGADMIKVGIGPGSACTTRIKTGFGYPQLSAIMDCARCSRPIIADGGIKTPGDAAKALAAGAKMVMIGGLLAGTDETPNFAKNEDGNVLFRGMASREANESFYGKMDSWKTAEGVSTNVQAKGSAELVIADLMGGIRSAMTYVGAENLTTFAQRTEFVRVTNASVYENSAHILNRN